MRRAGAVPIDSDCGPVAWWGECAWCGDRHRVYWCHVHSKGAFGASRWDPDNALPMCVECHDRSHGSGAKAWAEFRAWKFGAAHVAMLAARVRARVKVDVEAVREALVDELHELMEGRRRS